MKVHRLIIIEDITNERQLVAVEDVIPMTSAWFGMINQDLAAEMRRTLEAGDVFRDVGVMAGVRTRIILTPAHARNRRAFVSGVTL